MEAIMAHLVSKRFVERANAALLLGILWSGLAICVLGALSYDIAHWFGTWRYRFEVPFNSPVAAADGRAAYQKACHRVREHLRSWFLGGSSSSSRGSV